MAYDADDPRSRHRQDGESTEDPGEKGERAARALRTTAGPEGAAAGVCLPRPRAVVGAATARGARVAHRVRLGGGRSGGGGRVERDPADAVEPDLDPGVGVE